MVSERDTQFTAEIPSFAKEIQRIFTAVELRDYLNTLKRTRFLAPRHPDLDADYPDDEI
jgi:hypothetical protein